MVSPEVVPTINLSTVNNNAFAIMDCVSKALTDAGADEEYVYKYLNEATSGDYDHLIGVTMEYVNVV